MAVNRVPVLKRCRALGLEPSYLGYDKKSNRQNTRAGKKVSEYGLQLREKQVIGKIVSIASYRIKAGDVIEIKEKARSLQRYKDIVEVTGGRLVPEWMDVDIENLKGTIKNLPTREMIDVPVNEMLIVELYSK